MISILDKLVESANETEKLNSHVDIILKTVLEKLGEHYGQIQLNDTT
jgi:hypothetical protein